MLTAKHLVKLYFLFLGLNQTVQNVSSTKLNLPRQSTPYLSANSMGKYSANYASYYEYDHRKTRQLKGTKVEHKES